MEEEDRKILDTYKDYIKFLHPSNELHRQIYDKYRREIRTLNDRNELEREIASEAPWGVWSEILYSISERTKRKIIDDFSKVGYIWSYLGFLNKSDPRTMLYYGRGYDIRSNQIRYPEVENVPQFSKATFEMASSVISLDAYKKMLDQFSQSDTPGFVEDFKATRPRFLLHGINLRRGRFGGPNAIYEQKILPNGGWTKRQVVNAILATGLIDKLNPGLLNEALGVRNNIITSSNGHIKGHLPGFMFTTRRTYKGNPVTRILLAERNIPFDNFTGDYYMPKYYYEVIYRKLTSSLMYIDWDMCRDRKYNYKTLKWIGETLGLPPNTFDLDDTEENYNNVCTNLATISENRRNLLLEVPQIAPALLLQPGGQIMYTAETISRFKPIEPKPEALSLIQQQISSVCLAGTTLEENYKQILRIISLARKLDILKYFPEDLENLTLAQSCGILNNYAKTLKR